MFQNCVGTLANAKALGKVDEASYPPGMPTITSLLRESARLLKPRRNEPLATRLARELASFVLRKPVSWLIAHDQELFPARALRSYRVREKRLAQGEPLPYLTGSAPFLGRSFFVTRSTLIPRVETEELVEHVLTSWPKHERDTLAIDIGTGSGCIAISLACARDPRFVIASDVSKRALSVARKNANALLGTRSRNLVLLHESLLGPKLLRAIKTRKPTYLLICANLPYLPTEEESALAKTSTRFEPRRALFSGQTGTVLIEKLLFQIGKLATSNSQLRIDVWFEFHPTNKARLELFLHTHAAELPATFLKDQFGRWRFLHLHI